MAKSVSYTPVDATLQRADFVPSNLAAAGLLSSDNKAINCYTKQTFSGDLQVFLVSYVVSIQSYFSVYK